MTRSICKYDIYVVNAKTVAISSGMVEVPRTKFLPFMSIYDHNCDVTKQIQFTVRLFMFMYGLLKFAINT